ncbi:MAG: arnA [Gammaproteobacteria bacterium]|jgi:nucleoside-diphosphate-sugar epimerase|nr:arnA [Gammaproteobacteria bacterium]
MTKKVFIIGANGFIGSHLIEQILEHTDWSVIGLDLHQQNLTNVLSHERLSFKQGDMFTETAWIDAMVEQADVVLPLAAIANPALYVKDPLRVFELDFEANLAIVRLCVKHKKRVVFPSTSEVYGMCEDKEFDEETSNFVLGPINKPRWIYSCSKQLLDRVISAYGQQGDLAYTLFRPFNFMGPRLDNLHAAGAGGARAFTQFVGNVMRGQPIQLVDGGKQQRCYIYVDDAIDALMRIIENKNDCAAQQIFNIGNPHNNVSMHTLAEMVIAEMKNFPSLAEQANKAEIVSVSAEAYFGAGYQDVNARVPSIKRAETILHWKPVTSLQKGIRKTLEFYFS